MVWIQKRELHIGDLIDTLHSAMDLATPDHLSSFIPSSRRVQTSLLPCGPHMFSEFKIGYY